MRQHCQKPLYCFGGREPTRGPHDTFKVGTPSVTEEYAVDDPARDRGRMHGPIAAVRRKESRGLSHRKQLLGFQVDGKLGRGRSREYVRHGDASLGWSVNARHYRKRHRGSINR
jgi:hypothetical protein